MSVRLVIMMRLLVVFLMISVFVLSSHAKVWNPSTDPLPPLQPKEVGMQTFNSQPYRSLVTGEDLFKLEVSGYQFLSYESKIIVAWATGQNALTNPPAPLMQYSWSNFTSGKSLLAQYATQSCVTGDIEGASSFSGYDFYRNYLMLLYSLNITITFDNFTFDAYGPCMVFTAPALWNNPALPRKLVYTLIFQNSTGYLMQYSVAGTEYCCNDMVCPNDGLCSDGTAPFLTYASTNQTLSKYQLFSSASWPSGFFKPFCPFHTTSDMRIIA